MKSVPTVVGIIQFRVMNARSVIEWLGKKVKFLQREEKRLGIFILTERKEERSLFPLKDLERDHIEGIDNVVIAR